MGGLIKKLDDYIKRYSKEFKEEFKQLVRIPTVSTKDENFDEACDFIIARLKSIGASVRKVGGKKYPIIYGRVGSGEKCLIVYAHYDVQPEGNSNDWCVPPFSAKEVKGKIYGRGTVDNKNGVTSSMQAAQILMDVYGELPLKILFVFDGQEEIGSPSLENFISEHKIELEKADGILCCDAGGIDNDGRPYLFIGWKGDLHIEIKASSNQSVLHSSFGVIVKNPAWRVVKALSLMVQNDKIIIDNFYDKINIPENIVKEVMSQTSELTKEKLESMFGLKIKEELSGIEAFRKLSFEPVININGLLSGFTTEGELMAIIPSDALAKVDFRLVPNQDPDEIFEKVRLHLQRCGYNDITLKKLVSTKTYIADPNESIIQISKKILKATFRKKPIIGICPAAAAVTLFPRILNIPMTTFGSGSLWLAHKINEHIRVDNYFKGIKAYALLFKEFSNFYNFPPVINSNEVVDDDGTI